MPCSVLYCRTLLRACSSTTTPASGPGRSGGRLHNRTGEDNADAHLKRQVMGREVVVAVTNGRLDFGTWERIFYGEFDGRRRKRVLVKIIGE
jgi:secondary thiamine-phosphate synthase enzyme